MIRFVTALWGIDLAKSITVSRIVPYVLPNYKRVLSLALHKSLAQWRHSETRRRTRRAAFRISSFLRHSTFALRHSFHALKKKTPVSTAFMINIASKDWTTAVVVACPTPSAPPSTVSPALHEIVMMIQAKTTLLIIPEYKSQVSALSSARKI